MILKDEFSIVNSDNVHSLLSLIETCLDSDIQAFVLVSEGRERFLSAMEMFTDKKNVADLTIEDKKKMILGLVIEIKRLICKSVPLINALKDSTFFAG